MNKTIINKISISSGVRFDFEIDMKLGALPYKDIKIEVEEYMSTLSREKRLKRCKMFHLNYIDLKSECMLKLFFYKSETIHNMQIWTLVGICKAEDWSTDADDRGLIRSWLKSKIDELADEVDWVVTYRQWQAEQERSQEGYGN